MMGRIRIKSFRIHNTVLNYHFSIPLYFALPILSTKHSTISLVLHSQQTRWNNSSSDSSEQSQQLPVPREHQHPHSQK